MSLQHCGSCRVPLPGEDLHSECVSCLGPTHAETALNKAGCAHCERLPLAVLRSHIAAFKGTASHAPPPKKQWSREPDRHPEVKANPPHFFSPRRHPVTFSHEDQRPLPSNNGMVSFGGLDNIVELMSLDSELEDRVTSDEPSKTCPQSDSELIHIFTKATSELGLQWSPPTEPVFH